MDGRILGRVLVGIVVRHAGALILPGAAAVGPDVDEAGDAVEGVAVHLAQVVPGGPAGGVRVLQLLDGKAIRLTGDAGDLDANATALLDNVEAFVVPFVWWDLDGRGVLVIIGHAAQVDGEGALVVHIEDAFAVGCHLVVGDGALHWEGSGKSGDCRCGAEEDGETHRDNCEEDCCRE